MKAKVEFFDPPMCCSTGICGPSVDEKLVKVSENIELLKKDYGVEVGRYMISQQPLKFKDNEEVFKLVKENGKTILPITAVNGKVIATGEYPSLEEILKSIEGEKLGD